MFMWRSMLAEGNELSIKIHKKGSQQQPTHEPGSEGFMPKADIKFDDLRKHLSFRTNCEGIFTSISPGLLIRPQ